MASSLTMLVSCNFTLGFPLLTLVSYRYTQAILLIRGCTYEFNGDSLKLSRLSREESVVRVNHRDVEEREEEGVNLNQ